MNKINFSILAVGLFGGEIVLGILCIAKDQNNNVIEKVEIESRCAANIIDNLPHDMVSALKRVRAYALNQMTENFDTIYFPDIISRPNLFPRNLDIIEFIEFTYPQFKSENTEKKKDIFRKYINSVLAGPLEKNVEQQMILIGAVGQEVKTPEYDSFMAAIGTMRKPVECPGTPDPRTARQPRKLSYIYRGIYAISNATDAQTLNLEKRKLSTLNGINTWIPNEENCFIKALRDAGLPAVAGPSGSVGPLMNAAIQAQLSPQELLHWRALAAASTVDGGHHSFAEALYSSDQFLTKRTYHADFLKSYDEQIQLLRKVCPKL